MLWYPIITIKYLLHLSTSWIMMLKIYSIMSMDMNTITMEAATITTHRHIIMTAMVKIA